MCGQVWYESGSDRLLDPLTAARGFVGLRGVQVLRPSGGRADRAKKREEKREMREKRERKKVT